MTLFAAIEAGGTKFVCAIGDQNAKIVAQEEFHTENPSITMPKVINFFKNHQKEFPFQAVGIGSFGPVDPSPESRTYGFITSTPKLAWQNFNFVGALKKAFNMPVGFDTDVNAAALGEYYWGHAKGLTDFVYLTVGTGIGGGAMVNGKLLHGAMHPEMGHILIPHDKTKDPFTGNCPFHKNCLEGMASGPSINKRWNLQSSSELPPEHFGWDLESDYLAYAMANYILMFSPQRIILGGGVMKQKQLLPMIHHKTKILLAGYINHPSVHEIEKTIVLAKLDQLAGLYGSIALADRASNF